MSDKLSEYQKFYIVSRTHLDDIRQSMKRLELFASNITEIDVLNFMEQLAIKLNAIQLGNDVVELPSEIVEKFKAHRDKVLAQNE